MDDQTIKLGFQVDTTQVASAVKTATLIRKSIDDVDAANTRAAKNTVARASATADAVVGATADKTSKIDAIETRFAAAEYRRQVKREQNAIKAAEAAVDAEVKKAAQIQAIEDKAYMAEYRQNVRREADLERAAAKQIAEATRVATEVMQIDTRLSSDRSRVAARIGTQMIAVDQAAVQGAAAATQTFGRRGNAGLALLEFSRLTEDAQYGVAGVLNNIPTLVMLMGGAGGLAGAVSLVAVGANLLYKNWDKVETLWKVSPIETQTERMTRLAESTHKTAEETKELTRWQTEQANLAKLLAMPSQEQKKEGGQVGEAVNKVGGSRAYEIVLKAAQEADERRTGLPTKSLPQEFQDRQRVAASELLTEAMKGNLRAVDLLRDVIEKSSYRGDELAHILGPSLSLKPISPIGPDSKEDKAFRAIENQKADDAEIDMLNKLGQLYEDESLVAEARAINAEKQKKKDEAEQAAKDAQKDQDRKGERAAQVYAPIFADALGNRMQKGAAGGEDAKALDESLTKQVETKLKRDGRVPEAQRAAMARQIVAQTRQQFDDFSSQSDANRMAMNYSMQSGNPNAKLTYSQIFGRRQQSASAKRRTQLIKQHGRLSPKRTEAAQGVTNELGEEIVPGRKTPRVAPEDMFKLKPGAFKDLPGINVKSLDSESAAADKSVSLLESVDKSLARIEANTSDALRAKNVAILG